MYGGLFGDLPPAKKDSKKKKDGDSKSGEPVGIKEKKQQQAENTTLTSQPSTEQGTDTKKVKETVRQEPKAIKPSSLVQTIGVAGTSMAFIPSHLSRKRNIAKSSSSGSRTNTSSSAATASATSANVSETKKIAKVAPVPTTDLASWKEERQQDDSGQSSIHIHNLSSANTFSKEQSTGFTAASEPEELRLLHESVTDFYDPLIPNDLLQHWESQAAIQERKEIEREARETMEAQMRIRQRLEMEQKELEKAGDVDKILEHRKMNAVPGRGRGRGVSNLPAWLVEKQRKEAEIKKELGDS